MTLVHLRLEDHDRGLRARSSAVLVGVDEVGRGCLAGPVVAAAVILPDGARLPGLDDSKNLTAGQREELAAAIRACAQAIGFAFVGPREIDAINIRQASLLAMRRAVLRARARHRGAGAPAAPGFHVLVDGLDAIPGLGFPQESVVGGDGRSLAIAAASVVAKTVRDGFMARLAADHPAYGFERNKGYGTAEHLAAIAARGPCAWHRFTFSPVAQGTLW